MPQLLRRHAAPITSAVALLAAVALLILFAADTAPAATTFFGVGVSVLVASLAWVKHTLNTDVPRAIVRPGWAALAKLGIRNARRHPGRTMLTVGLIASATFVIASLQAFRIEIDARPGDRHSASGGFALYAESALPLQYDLNTPAGRDAINVSAPTQELLDQTTVIPFRLRPGDASGCRNLYKPVDPRILGATDAMTKRGGFVFSSTLADNEAERENPWQLLRREFPDGAVPTIADEASVLWQLHSGLGKDFVMTDERGRDVRLRFVALLKGSALQDELVIAEDQFTRLFPSISGYGFFLIEVPAASADELSAALEHDLTSFGFDVAGTVARLADYAAVQNTYLSTFQTLGGLGLILGTIGLTAVMLRNVWERRGELALMRAVGFSVRALGWMVLVENAALVVAGLTIGTVAAAVAVAPHVVNRSENLPWLSLVVILAGVFLTAMLSGVAALIPTLRAPLLPALRSE